jgi:branched-chain amino acid aminotransferase
MSELSANWLSEEEWLHRWKTGLVPLQGPYLGYYSSVVDGFFKEPWGFWVPVDDHLVHRGDGVFEAMRIIDRAYFDLESHLTRLERSAAKIFLTLPFSVTQIRERCLQLAKLCDESEAVLRLYVGRGPGSFSPNPYEPKRSQLYMAMTPWKSSPGRWYEEGVRAGVSLVEGKRPFDATIKSCNYLQNVLQKKDAVDRGFDFTVCVNEDGCILEGATESFCIITADGHFLIPSTDMTLPGTTMGVTKQLAEELVKEGRLKSVKEARFRVEDVTKAREAAFVGTTIAVTPVTRWEKGEIGDGRVGPIASELGKRLDRAMRTDPKVRTPF